MIKNIMRVAGALTALTFVTSPVLADSHGAAPMNNGAMNNAEDMKMNMKMSAEVVLGDLVLSKLYTRAMPPAAKSGGGFVTITNNGTESDRLVSASSDVANMVQIHEMVMDGDVMRMSEMKEGVLIPAGESVMLKPGGLHIMFMEVKQPFVEGEMVKVTLIFEKAGSVDIMLAVGSMGMKMKH